MLHRTRHPRELGSSGLLAMLRVAAWAATVLLSGASQVAAEQVESQSARMPSPLPWATHQIIQHPELHCVTFLARTPQDGLLATTFNNTNTTDVVRLWHVTGSGSPQREPRVVLEVTVGGYRGFGGVAAAPDGSVVVSVDGGPNEKARLYKLTPDFQPDELFGTSGVLELKEERAFGVAISSNQIHVAVAWGRLLTLCLDHGQVLSESVPNPTPAPAEGSEASVTAGFPPVANPTTSTKIQEVTVPPWMLAGDSAGTAPPPRIEGKPRIRDIAADPAQGWIYGVAADRVYVWRPSSGGGPPMVGPSLLIDGKGPVTPAQGIHFDPATRMLRYAVHDVGTLAQAQYNRGYESSPELSLFDLYQATSPSARAVDSVVSADGQTLWVSNLTGSIVEYRRRPSPPAYETLHRRGKGAAGQQGRGPQRLPSWDALKERFPSASPILLRGDKPWRAEGQTAPVILLVLYVNPDHQESLAAASQFAVLTDRLPDGVMAAVANVQIDRRLLLLHSVYRAPTLVAVDLRNQLLARHEGELDSSALAEVIARAERMLKPQGPDTLGIRPARPASTNPTLPGP